FTITATDVNGCTGSRSYTLSVVCPTITLTPNTLPDGTVAIPYSQTITASGGIGPYTFSVTAGTLPAGLLLSSAGVLSGTPTTAATSNFTFDCALNHTCDGPAIRRNSAWHLFPSTQWSALCSRLV